MPSSARAIRERLTTVLGVLPELPPFSLPIAVELAGACLERRLSDKSEAVQRRLRGAVQRYLSPGGNDPTVRRLVSQIYSHLSKEGEPRDDREVLRQALRRSDRIYTAVSIKLPPPDRSLRDWEHVVLRAIHREELAELGHAPEASDPIPGCSCVGCLSLAAGSLPAEAYDACEMIHHLALVPASEREEAVRRANQERQRHGRVPHRLSPALLARKAAELPRSPEPKGSSDTIAPSEDRGIRKLVREARRVPILEVVDRLNLSQPVAKGSEYAVLCPFHDDSSPSLRLNPERDIWQCFVCGEGGDAIDLAQQVLGLEFVETARWLTKGRVA